MVGQDLNEDLDEEDYELFVDLEVPRSWSLRSVLRMVGFLNEDGVGRRGLRAFLEYVFGGGYDEAEDLNEDGEIDEADYELFVEISLVMVHMFRLSKNGCPVTNSEW